MKVLSNGAELVGGTSFFAAVLIIAVSVAVALRLKRTMGEHRDLYEAEGPGAAGTRSAALSAPEDSAARSRYVGHVVLAPVAGERTRGTINLALAGGALPGFGQRRRAVPGAHSLILVSEPTAMDRGAAAHSDQRTGGHSPAGATQAAPTTLRQLGVVMTGASGRGDLTLFIHPASYPLDRRDGWRTLIGKAVELRAPGEHCVACGIIARRAPGGQV